MTKISDSPSPTDIAARVEANLKRRYAAERRFRLYGLVSVGIALIFLFAMLISIFSNGYSAFVQNEIRLDIKLESDLLGLSAQPSKEELANADYQSAVNDALYSLFPEVTSRGERRKLSALLSSGASFELQDLIEADPTLIGQTLTLWVPASDDVDMYRKGKIAAGTPMLGQNQADWIAALEQQDRIAAHFNWRFLKNGDSREPELAGIWGALVGSFYSILITLIVSFPLGVATAIYLEEFAPRNKWTDLIEVNINNLAAVPSIVFGLLGLAVFLNLFDLPRSAPLVGGLVLALISLPTVIIATRVAMKAVPPSIREAAFGLGASRLQVVTHHVLPLSMPGILTGTILGMAHALGETAPLLMIGMVAFIVDTPVTPLDPAAVLPVQVYLWADSPERAFVEKTSAAIIVLLFFLAIMNAVAIYLRKKFERRW